MELKSCTNLYLAFQSFIRKLQVFLKTTPDGLVGVVEAPVLEGGDGVDGEAWQQHGLLDRIANSNGRVLGQIS
jgi:hypothetical protein